MGFKDFLLIGLLFVGLLVGYDYLTSNVALTRDITPGLYATPQEPVLISFPTNTVSPTWTPEPINFQATTDAYLNSLPTQTPVVLVATRPPFENLPAVGPYSPEQIAVCRATYEQGLEGQLSMFQAQYELCFNALYAEGFFN